MSLGLSLEGRIWERMTPTQRLEIMQQVYNKQTTAKIILQRWSELSKTKRYYFSNMIEAHWFSKWRNLR